MKNEKLLKDEELKKVAGGELRDPIDGYEGYPRLAKAMGTSQKAVSNEVTGNGKEVDEQILNDLPRPKPIV